MAPPKAPCCSHCHWDEERLPERQTPSSPSPPLWDTEQGLGEGSQAPKWASTMALSLGCPLCPNMHGPEGSAGWVSEQPWPHNRKGWPYFHLPGRGCRALLGQELCYNDLKPSDKTALPVLLWEVHVLEEQGGHLLVPRLSPWGTLKQYLLKYLSQRFCCIFLWRHNKYLRTQPTFKKMGHIFLLKKKSYFYFLVSL